MSGAIKASPKARTLHNESGSVITVARDVGVTVLVLQENHGRPAALVRVSAGEARTLACQLNHAAADIDPQAEHATACEGRAVAPESSVDGYLRRYSGRSPDTLAGATLLAVGGLRSALYAVQTTGAGMEEAAQCLHVALVKAEAAHNILRAAGAQLAPVPLVVSEA